MTIVLAVLSGVLCAVSFPKFGAPAFAWVALAPLIVSAAMASRTRRPLLRRPFFLGLITGLIYFGGTLYWLAGTMATYGVVTVGWVFFLADTPKAWYLLGLMFGVTR